MFIRGAVTSQLVFNCSRCPSQRAAEKQNKCINGFIFTVTHFCLKSFPQGTVSNTFAIVIKSCVISVICS